MLVMKVAQPLTITGTLTDSTGLPMEGVTVSLTGDTTVEVVTDSAGFYSIEVYNGGSYTVSPALAGWVFEPASRTYSPLAHREWSQDFTNGRWTGVGEVTIPVVFDLQVVDLRIRYSVSCPTSMKMAIYDVTGREVRTLVEGPVEAGVHTLYWDGKDNLSRSVSRGVYFVRMVTPGFQDVKKTVLLR